MGNQVPKTRLTPTEFARIENALLELFAAFGLSLHTIQNSIQANTSDGLQSTELVLPSMNIMGLKLSVDQNRSIDEGMYIKCKKPEQKYKGPEAAV